MKNPKSLAFYIQVGKYRIEVLTDGTLYLGHESGEGMGVSVKKFEKVLDKFFKEEF